MTRKDVMMATTAKSKRGERTTGRKTAPAKAKVSAAGGNGATPKRAKAAPIKLWELRLYVAGQTPKSVAAMSNLERICDQHLHGQYRIEVVDLLKNPQLAQGDQIVAIPTLVRKLPEPIKRVIGGLSNIERVLVGMDIRAAG